MPLPKYAALVFVLCACKPPSGSPQTGNTGLGAMDTVGRPEAAAPDDSATRLPAADETASEPAAMTIDEAWAWVRAALPEESGDLRLLEESEDPLDRLLGWIEPGATAVVFDRLCRKLTLTRNEASLDGALGVRAERRGKTKLVSGEAIRFDHFITLLGGFMREYERDAGSWEEVGAMGSGCLDYLGHRLSEVTDTQAWYGGAAVTISLVCRQRREAEQRCHDGTTRVCTFCERIGLSIRSLERHFMVSTVGGASTRTPAGPDLTDCTVLCPPDERVDEFTTLNASLEKAKFLLTDIEEHPTLFRTRAACREYRKRHRLAAEDHAQW